MKFSSVVVLSLLSTVVTTLASPIKRAADPATQAANAQDAIDLNTKFASLTADSPCTDGQNACVQGSFAQCSGNKFSLTPCAAGTQCFALPLVNKRGTSLTCDTVADRDARIEAAKNAGGTPADSPTTPATAPESSPTPTAPATSPTPVSGGDDIAAIRKQNAADAIAQQKQFDSLTANSPCTDGQNACVQGSFAQCSGNKFSLTPCAAGTQCFALPLVNKRGTSITCDTAADRDARIEAAQGTPPADSPTTPATPPADSPTNPATPPKCSTTPTAPATSPTPVSGGDDIAAIRKQNAADAIAQQKQFDSLTADSPCTDGQNACVQGSFAQCSGNKFSLTPCAAGTQCFALPLVNKRGTSITCDTAADRDARIEAAQGTPPADSPTTPATPADSPTTPATPADSPTTPAPATSPTPVSGGGDIAAIRKQNAADAIAQQQSFSSLTADSPCTDGQNACVQNSFAQCSGGKFALSPCSGGTQCFALPLVNKRGTSVTCDTQADRDTRIERAQNGQA